MQAARDHRRAYDDGVEPATTGTSATRSPTKQSPPLQGTSHTTHTAPPQLNVAGVPYDKGYWRKELRSF